MERLIRLRIGKKKDESARHHKDIDHKTQEGGKEAHLGIGQKSPVASPGQQSQQKGEPGKNNGKIDRPDKSKRDGKDPEYKGRSGKSTTRMLGGRRIGRRISGISVLIRLQRIIIIVIHRNHLFSD